MAHLKKVFTAEPWKAHYAKSKKAKDWTEVLASTLLDTAAGVGGATLGSFCGWIGVPVGMAITATGHATGYTWMNAAGIGCTVAPFDQIRHTARMAGEQGFNLKAEFEAGKERAKEYIGMLKDKFFISKLTGKNQPAQQTNTTDTPDTETVNGLDPGIEKATLDKLTEFDQQIISDGIEYQAKNGSSPDTEVVSPVNGVEELDELPHII